MDRRSFVLSAPALALAGCVSVPGTDGPPVPAPQFKVGDRWVYSGRDGFRLPVTWEETHEVTAAGADGLTLRVTAQGPTVNSQRTERWSAPGIITSGAVFDDETRTFAPPLIRFQFPLTPQSRWNQSINTTIELPPPPRPDWINRFVQVGGYTKVTVPAGTFDCIAMRILQTVNSNDPFFTPTSCNYEGWWAPAVGALVRETKYATYRERSDTRSAIEIRAQNTTLELLSFRRA